jgi:AcrR family transcriptional regulator
MSDWTSRKLACQDRIRPPLQRRSQAAWNRILDAGMQILIEQGRDALTIQAVCRRAKVSPTALYARVDGLSGLFWAIYDRGIGQVITTYERLLDAAAQTEDSVERVRAVVRAMCENFHRHERFLHQIINISVADEALRRRGSRESLVYVERVAALLPQRPAGAAADAARMVHQECVFRAMYGDRWLSRRPESWPAFTRRVTAMALGRFGWLDPGR